MNVSEPFIRRPIMTTLVMLALLFFGILAFKALPVSDLPNVDYPTITVSTSFPGADPQTMANNVATPLEKQLMTISGITSIASSSGTGQTSITLQFSLDKSMLEASQDVQAMINQAMPFLPKDLPYTPIYSKTNPAENPILFYALTSDSMTFADLYDYAQNILAKQISIIQGVSNVYVYGAEWAVRVQIDPQKLAAKNLSFEDIGAAIKESIPSQPTGLLYGPRREYTISVEGQIFQASGYEKLIIKTTDGQIVRLSEVGRALNSLTDDKFYLSYAEGGKISPSVVMAIKKQPGENALGVINNINAILPGLKQELPASIALHTLLDKTEFIKEAVQDVELTLLIAFVLVITVIFIYLGRFLNTLIPILALPLAVIGTFAVMYLFGFTVDILSLLAVTLSIGFLVDDAVVVLENLVRHVESGETPFQAALKGSGEISFTILSMALSLAAVFLPMAFLGGVIGKLFKEFAIVIMSATLLSGFISLTLTPMLASRLIPPWRPEEKRGRVERFSEHINAFFIRHYRASLSWVLDHKKSVLAVGAASFALTLLLFFTLPKDFLPDDDIGSIQGFTLTQDGTSPFEMAQLQQRATELIKDNPSFQSLVSVGAIPQDNQGLFFITLKPPHERPPIGSVIASLYHTLLSLPGLQVFFKPYPLINLQVATGATQGQYQYTLRSLSLNELYRAAVPFIDRMKTLPGFRQVTSDMHISQPRLHLKIDRDRASSLNVTAQAIESTLGLAYSGAYLALINKPDGQYKVILETLPAFYREPNNLSQLYVRSSKGELIRLDNVVTIEEDVGPLTVSHMNGLPSVTITFNLHGLPLSSAVSRLEGLAKKSLPPSVAGALEGVANVFAASFSNLNFLLLITLFTIYIILGILYENFFHPLTVMSTLPAAALGGLFILFAAGYSFSLYAFVGLIMVLGIVLKNGIILVDFAHVAMTQEGMNSRDAVLHAAATRFRPIVMTTLAALMGALPIALGIGGVTAAGKRPLGLVVVFGLLLSQLLTLYITPVVYIYMEKLASLFKRRQGRG